jgi:hypothetical protein
VRAALAASTCRLGYIRSVSATVTMLTPVIVVASAAHLYSL